MPLFPMPLTSTFSFVLHVAARARHREAFRSGYVDRPSEANLTMLLHPCVALVSAVVLGGDGGK